VLTGSEGGLQGSLLNEIDRTVTSMGGRMLRSWLLRPLISLERIRDRLDAVEELAFRATDRGRFREVLKTRPRRRAPGRPRRAWHGGTARSRRAADVAAAIPRLRLMLDEVQAPLLAACWPSSTISPTSAI
jgi:DNA mismatch repair protein MutS